MVGYYLFLIYSVPGVVLSVWLIDRLTQKMPPKRIVGNHHHYALLTNEETKRH